MPKPQTWNGVIFGKEQKISQTAKKKCCFNFERQFRTTGSSRYIYINIYIYVDLYMVHIWWVVFFFKYEYDSKSEIYWTIWCSIRKSLSPGQGFLVLCSDLTGKQTWENHGGSMCLLGWFIFFCWRLCGYWGNEFGRSKTCWDLHRFWVMLPTSILYRWVEVVELIAIWYPETWSLRPSWWLNLGAFASFLRRFDVILCV